MKRRLSVRTLLVIAFALVMNACSSEQEKNVADLELYRIHVGDKYGFINQYGDIVIEPQFDVASFYFGNNVCFARLGERRGLINSSGEFIVELPSSTDYVWPFSHGTSRFVNTDGRYGIIDTLGTIIVPAIYKNINRDGAHGFIITDTNDNMGYANNQGNIIVPCKYDAVNGFHEELMVVATSEACGYVDTLGKWAIPAIYEDARAFGDGLARVKKNGEWMFIDKKGNKADLPNYDEILTGFSCKRAFVKKGGRIMMIDVTGRLKKQIEADSVYGFHEGYATFKKDGRYAVIDTNGDIAIQNTYDGLLEFADGIAKFKQGDKSGMVDTAGKVIVEAKHNVNCGCWDNSSLLWGQDTIGGEWPLTYYDRQGHEIWRDMPKKSFTWPSNPTKKDFVAYFDSRLSELDPIEGVYYTTFNEMAVNRENDHVSSNGSLSKFFAVMKNGDGDNFIACFIDEKKPWSSFVKKFVKIGESNTYAVVNNDAFVDPTGLEDGKLVLEDPNHFEVTLRYGGNNWYDWYVQCEFVKDYPTSAEYELIQQAEWAGSGFAVADGYVATNYHVVNGAKSIIIKGVNGDEKERYKGYVVATDRDHDLAIVRIVDKKFKGFDDIPYCIGKAVPEVGDDVFVLGYPLTSTMGNDVKLTNGIISAASGYKGDQAMYQISAPVQPGNSGGPLFDNDGNVVGIVCAKHAEAENANYAIKVSYLYNLVCSSGIGIKMANNNKVKSTSLSKKVKQVKPFVYLIECSRH